MVKVKNKKLKKLLYEKNWLDKKVAELTKDRKKDRSWDAKATKTEIEGRNNKTSKQIGQFDKTKVN